MGKKKVVKFRKNKTAKKTDYKTTFILVFFTFIFTILFSYVFESLMGRVSLQIAFLVLLIIIFIGVLADGIGNAVVTAKDTPFHSMAAKKVKGAKESLMVIRNAPAVANFFNDVIGDICGVISGAAAASIVLQLEKVMSINTVIFAMAMSGVVASITVGGKAIGKGIAITYANAIVYRLGLFISLFSLDGIIKDKNNHKN